MAKFDIAIVGGGLVGLAAAIGLRRKGHNTQVVEASSALQIAGDAIAVAANQQCVLEHYGILDDFRDRAVKNLGAICHRRYSTGEIISTRDMKAQEENYGYATYILSRQGYQRFLYEQAVKTGVEVLFNRRVKSVDDTGNQPKIVFQDGLQIQTDIIVGADGVKSAVRGSLYPLVGLKSDLNCYRATIPHKLIQDDPQLAPLMTGINFFMGPNLLVIQSNMTDIEEISLNMYHPGNTGTAGAWKAAGDINRLRETFKDFSPEIQKLIHLVDECVVWKVVEVPPLPSWVSERGRTVLIGDAAHAMTPHQGQGCAMGIEDGGALAECLGRATSLKEVPALLKVFEQLRKPRAELIAGASGILGKIWSMPDGDAQEQRDNGMRNMPIWSAGAWDGKPIDRMPSSMKDPIYQPWVMSHDCVAYANRQLDALC